MTFKNIIWKYEPKHDYTCAIKIYVRVNKKVKYFQVQGVYVEEKFWDNRRGRVKKQHPLHQIYNANIIKLRNKLELHFLSGGAFDKLDNKDVGITIQDLFEDFIKKSELGEIAISKGTIANYKSTLKRYKDFIRDTSFSGNLNEVDKAFSDNFIRYMVAKNISLNTINNHFSRLKALMDDDNRHSNEKFRKELSVKKKGGKKMSGLKKQIYLTHSEILKIENAPISGGVLEKERDRFLICYYLLLRFGDAQRISRNSIISVDGKEYFHQLDSEKTEMEQMLPLNSKAKSLLEKYNYDFKFTDNKVANKSIRRIAEIAGIDDLIHTKNGSKKKYELINTHSARRSAATNLRLQGASLKTISDLGGWKNIETLRHYLKASGLDTAKMAQNLDHFK